MKCKPALGMRLSRVVCGRTVNLSGPLLKCPKGSRSPEHRPGPRPQTFQNLGKSWGLRSRGTPSRPTPQISMGLDKPEVCGRSVHRPGSHLAIFQMCGKGTCAVARYTVPARDSYMLKSIKQKPKTKPLEKKLIFYKVSINLKSLRH